MIPQTLLERIQAKLLALTWGSPAARIFLNDDQVLIGDETTQPPIVRDPWALITPVESEPYGSHGHALAVATINVRVRAVTITPQGEGHVLDTLGRPGGVETIWTKVQNTLWFNDTTSAGARTTWWRVVSGGMPRPIDRRESEATWTLEALVQTGL